MALAVAVLVLAAGCGMVAVPMPADPATPATPPPAIGRILHATVITDERAVDQRSTYDLADGRTVEVDRATQRVVFSWGGSPLMLVEGADAAGPWWAIVGHQDGMPADCFVMNERGFDYGDAVAIAGVRWPKAPGFQPAATPAFAQPYPHGARFCLDSHAQVTSLVLNP